MRRLLIVALLLAGCGLGDSLKGEREMVSYYTLDASPPPEAASAGERLGLEDVQGQPQVDLVQFVRRLKKDSHEFFLYPENHLWAALPRAMVTELATRHFRDRWRVQRHPGLQDPDLVLRLRLARFEEIRDSGQESGTALVTLEASISRWRDGREHPPVLVVASGEAPVKHRGGYTVDAEEVARAMKAATVAALEQVAGRLAEAR